MVNFIFFVNSHSFSITECVFGDWTDYLFLFGFVMLGQQLPPFCCCHFYVLLRFGFGVSDFFVVYFLFLLLFYDFLLVFTQSTDGLFVKFLLLGVWVVGGWTSKNIEIFYLHIDVYFRSFLVICKVYGVTL